MNGIVLVVTGKQSLLWPSLILHAAGRCQTEFAVAFSGCISFQLKSSGHVDYETAFRSHAFPCTRPMSERISRSVSILVDLKCTCEFAMRQYSSLLELQVRPPIEALLFILSTNPKPHLIQAPSKRCQTLSARKKSWQCLCHNKIFNGIATYMS